MTTVRDKWPWEYDSSHADILKMRTESRDTQSTLDGARELTSDALLTMVLDRTTDGVLLSGSDGTIMYANRPLLQMFGYDAEDLIGQSVDLLVPEHVRAQHHAEVARFNRSPEARPMGREDLDLEGRRADGSYIPIDVQLDALPGSSLVVATVRDMTTERQSSVDLAIGRIDLANARAEVHQLRLSLDLVIQRLFALGTSISAGASNGSVLSERLADAIDGVDQVIETVQESRQALGPRRPGHPAREQTR
jgi:PAS domain S-box-containing protein